MLLLHMNATVTRTNERLLTEETLLRAESRLLTFPHVHLDAVHLERVLAQTSLLSKALLAYLAPELAFKLRVNGECSRQFGVVCRFHVFAELHARREAELALSALEPPLALRAAVDALRSLRLLFQIESRISDQRSEHFVVINRRRCVSNVTRACPVTRFLEFYRTNVESLQQPNSFESFTCTLYMHMYMYYSIPRLLDYVFLNVMMSRLSGDGS